MVILHYVHIGYWTRCLTVELLNNHVAKVTRVTGKQGSAVVLGCALCGWEVYVFYHA